VNRTFLYGLVSSAVGVAAGLGYRQYLVGRDRFSGLFGLVSSPDACTTSESWLGFLNAFALVTLVLCLVFALLGMSRSTQDGIVGVGDAVVVIGAVVALVEVVVFASFGSYLGIAYGVLVVALAMFAIKQERQTSLAVSWVMAVCAASWVLSDPDALLLGLAPCVLWALAGGAYAISLKVGEPV
jgi:hypothetical protein